VSLVSFRAVHATHDEHTRFSNLRDEVLVVDRELTSSWQQGQWANGHTPNVRMHGADTISGEFRDRNTRGCELERRLPVGRERWVPHLDAAQENCIWTPESSRN
jgi:hypothetical protein